MPLTGSLFWDVTQSIIVFTDVSVQLIGPHKERSNRYPRNVASYHSTPYNIPEEERFYPHRGGSLEACNVVTVHVIRAYWESGGIAPPMI